MLFYWYSLSSGRFKIVFTERDYDNLFCIDIICHGVPVSKVWNKYILHQEKYHDSSIRSATFRRKDEGWKNVFHIIII